MAEVEDLTSVSNSSSGSVKLIANRSVTETDSHPNVSAEPSLKRPVNPFILWSRVERKTIVEEGKLQGTEVSKELGKRWKKLSEDVRKQYIEEAIRLRSEFLEQYPEGACPRGRPKTSKLKKSPAKPVIGKKLLTKSGDVFDFPLKATAFPVKPPQNASSCKETAEKSLPSFGGSEFLEQYPKTPCQRPKASKHKKSPAKPAIRKKMLTKSGHVFDFPLKATAFPVKRPHKASSCKATAEKSLPSFGRSSPSQGSQYKLQFKIDENFSSNLDSVLDKTEEASKLSKLLKLKFDKKGGLLKKPLKPEDLPTSGDICRAAIKSRDCLQTFDYVSDLVIKSCDNLADMVCDIVKEYNDLVFSTRELVSSPYDDTNSEVPYQSIPLMSELIGEEWMLPNMGFELLP